jgi:hypothetical protein
LARQGVEVIKGSGDAPCLLLCLLLPVAWGTWLLNQGLRLLVLLLLLLGVGLSLMVSLLRLCVAPGYVYDCMQACG